MRIMGVDVSTKTGVSVIDFADGEEPDVLCMREITETRYRGMERARSIGDRVWAVAAHYVPDYAVVEGYGFGNVNTLALLVEVGTCVRLGLMAENLKWVEVPPNSLKKFLTGKGNAKKDLMMLQLYKRFGIETTNDNIADAIGLALFGGAIIGKVHVPKINMEAVKTLIKTNADVTLMSNTI